NPDINQTNIPRVGVSESRYRVSLEDRTNFTDSIYGIANITKLSDQYVLQDFFQGEFRIDPNPDNVVALTKINPVFTLTGIERVHAHRHRAFSGKRFLHHHGTSAGSCAGHKTARALWRTHILRRRNGLCEFAVTIPRGLRYQELWHGPFRHVPSTDLSEHVFWMALDRAASWISRHLLREDVGPRINGFCAANKSAGARHHPAATNNHQSHQV